MPWQGMYVVELSTNRSTSGLPGSQPAKDAVKACLAYDVILLMLEYCLY